MKLRDRVRIRLETVRAYKAHAAAGLKGDELVDAVVNEMQGKYGIDPKWLEIIELILTILMAIFAGANE